MNPVFFLVLTSDVGYRRRLTILVWAAHDSLHGHGGSSTPALECRVSPLEESKVRSRLFDERRRRLRVIQASGDEARKRLQSAAAALSVASVAEAHRHDLEYLHGKLMADCRPNFSWRLRVELDGAAPIEVGLDRSYLVIGSDADCDLHLSHEMVNPRHLLMVWIEGHLYCCDISNITGYRNARHRSSVGWWADEDTIEVGPYRLTVLNVATNCPDVLPLERSPRLMNEYPLLALQFDGVTQKDNVWPINRVLTLIGRSNACKLRLNHKSVELVHACLLRTQSGCWLIDLVKNRSTRVNGHVVPFASLDVGDSIQFGDFSIEVTTAAIHPPSKKDSLSTTTTSSRTQSNPASAEIIPFQAPEDGTGNRSSVVQPGQPVSSSAHKTMDSQQHRVELTSLKDQLEQLKQLYESVTGQLNSTSRATSTAEPTVERSSGNEVAPA